MPHYPEISLIHDLPPSAFSGNSCWNEQLWQSPPGPAAQAEASLLHGQVPAAPLLCLGHRDEVTAGLSVTGRAPDTRGSLGPLKAEGIWQNNVLLHRSLEY